MPPDHAAELLRLARLYISEDDAERLVGWLAWRTGRDPGSVRELPVIEQYTYLNVKLNVGLADADFDSENPNYNF